MKSRTAIASALAFAASSCCSLQAEIERKIDFVRDIKPIFEASCVGCHGENEEERGGKYRLDSKEAAFKGGSSYSPAIVAGKKGETPVWWMTTLIPDDGDDYDEVMPPEHQQPLNSHQQDLILAWVTQGAEWPDKVSLIEGSRVNFTAGIVPVLKKGGPFEGAKLDLIKLWAEQGADWPKGGKFGDENPEVPEIGAETEPDFAKVIGPLIKRGGPFIDAEVQVIRRWAEAGAPWQDGFELAEGNFTRNPDDIALVTRIRENIVENSKEKKEGEMKPYTETITETGVTFEMIPIPSGEFTMGSPDSEKNRKKNEGPQRQVEIAPFWMGKFEVTWDEYEPFMSTDDARNKDGSRQTWSAEDSLEELVSSPTTAYTEMSFGMGMKGFPAISMSQHAALKYCEWLSAQTGHYYRLPTEAEWEYACRAGTTTAYSWGDDPKEMDKYAWFFDNANDKYQKVGTKLPNPWGLYDVHGNVFEWTLDAYFADGYTRPVTEGASGLVPYVKPGEDLYPRTVRGGSYYDYPEDLRSSSRIRTHHSWKKKDPQLPKSIWYLTDAQWLGMRIVRPLETPTPEQMHEIWNSGAGEENEMAD
ncbi:MAG: sulfatase activating formylglycine-generating enzyme [Verrucomicrobiales bacterium]|jgi:formylglycine-generating enzyme required for sulfatase activity